VFAGVCSLVFPNKFFPSLGVLQLNMLNRHGWRLMSPRVEDEFDCIEAIFGEDFRRAEPSSANSAAIRVRVSQGIWIHLEAPQDYPEQKRLQAAVDKNWSCRGEYRFKELNAGMLGFLARLPMDTEMMMPVVEFARDFVLERVAPAIEDAHDTAQSQSQIDFSVCGPVAPVSGLIDNPPMPGGACLAIGTKVRVVGAHADLGDLTNRIGTLARYDKNKGQWWVQFPKFKDSAVRKRLLWDCAFVRPVNLMPLKREEAFDAFKHQLDLALQVSLESSNKEEALSQPASEELLHVDEEEELVRAIMASLTESEMQDTDGWQVVPCHAGMDEGVWVIA